MRKHAILIIAILCALLLTLGGCGDKGEQPLADLQAGDLVSAEIWLAPPDSTITISDGDNLAELAQILNQVTLYEQDDAGRETDGQLVQVTVTLSDGTTHSIGAYGDYMYYDGLCYQAKYEPSQALNAFGNSFYKELPDRGTPPPESIPTTEEVKYAYQHANMKLTLPLSWEYAINEYSEDSSTFGISFWPEDCTEGKLTLEYWVGGFGVCGTGLEQEEITLANGLTASQGTYDGHAVWDYLSFINTPGNYVVLNQGAEAWWDVHGDQAMDIIGSARLGEGILFEDEAIKVAVKECTVEHDRVRATFDLMEGVWEVRFYTSTGPGGDQIVRVSSLGEVLGSEYGE